MASIIEIVDLTKSFDKTVLSNIHLSFDEGQTMGLIGRNGAGKSTLIKIILGFLKPTGGYVKVFGKDPKYIKARIGYLPEKADYHLLFSGKEYLTLLACMARIDRVNERVREVLSLVGMIEHGCKRMSKYSKGMLQRIGLAQAVLSDPNLLILDEPLSGLDPSGQKDLRDIILELQNQKKSILLCSHLLNEVEKVCADIAIIHQGTIIRRGKIGDVLIQHNLYKLKVENLSQAGLKDISLHFKVSQPETGTIVYQEQLKGEKENLLKTLINHNVMINELKPCKRSLEEYFLDSTEGE